MNQSKFILGDIGAIKKHGFESYISHYFWPIPESKYQNSAYKMQDEYINIIENVKNPFLYEVALVELTFIAELQHIYHYQFVKQYATKNKLSLHYTDDSLNYFEPDWEKYSSFYYKKKFPYGRVIRAIRRIIKTFVFNRHLSFIQFIKGLLTGKSVISVGSYDRLKKEYVEKKSFFCHHYDWPDIFRQNSELDEDVNMQTFKIHKQVINPYLEFLATLDPVIFSKELINNIRISWDNRMKTLFLYSIAALFLMPVVLF